MCLFIKVVEGEYYGGNYVKIVRIKRKRGGRNNCDIKKRGESKF